MQGVISRLRCNALSPFPSESSITYRIFGKKQLRLNPNFLRVICNCQTNLKMELMLLCLLFSVTSNIMGNNIFLESLCVNTNLFSDLKSVAIKSFT